MRDDIEFNKTFCKLVEKHPALYDYMRPEYCNRSVQDKIWRKIARELNVKAQDCRDRWKNIRARYLKNVKERFLSTDKTVKEYYLAQHLQFLYRFLKRGKVKKKKSDTVFDIKNSDEENISHEESQRSLSSSPSLPQTILPHFLSVETTQRTDGYHEKQRENGTQINTDLTLDPDMAFLQSLLPDMKAMSDSQKRTFKIGILNMAGQILEERPIDSRELVKVKMEEVTWVNECDQKQKPESSS